MQSLSHTETKKLVEWPLISWRFTYIYPSMISRSVLKNLTSVLYPYIMVSYYYSSSTSGIQDVCMSIVVVTTYVHTYTFLDCSLNLCPTQLKTLVWGRRRSPCPKEQLNLNWVMNKNRQFCPIASQTIVQTGGKKAGKDHIQCEREA